MTAATSTPTYCSDLSLQAGEPLIGSATLTTKYLLLEYNGAWGEKALNESDIPEAVKHYLNSFSKNDPAAKVLLIHRRQPAQPTGLRCFLALVEENARRIYEFVFESYEMLLDLDLNAFFAAPERFSAHLRRDPLFLVCANGRRDLCCARRGLPVYRALENATATHPFPLVWECTHIGGHRFAANLIVFPHGLLYGRVDPDSALQILAASQEQRVFLPNLRGRTAYPPPAQAADQYLRGQTGENSLDAFSLEQVEPAGDGAWRIVFRRSDGKLQRLRVQGVESESIVYDSCRLDKTTTFIQYTVTSIPEA